MKQYSEVEKITLQSMFKKMLEEGRTHFTAETAELFGLGELDPKVQRKRFYISIIEEKMVEFR